MKNSGLLAFAGALMGLVTAASGADKVSEVFIRDAVQGNLAEIKLGQLAQEKTQSAEVKSYAQMLVTDHSTSNEQAEKAAKQIGITIPTELSVSQKVTYNRMSKLSGTAFDRAFVAEMIAGRKTSITRFQNEAKKNDDPAGDFATDAADSEEASRRGTAAGTGFMNPRLSASHTPVFRASLGQRSTLSKVSVAFRD